MRRFRPGQLVCLSGRYPFNSIVGYSSVKRDAMFNEIPLEKNQPLVYVRTWEWNPKFPDWNVEVLAGDQLITVYGSSLMKYKGE